MPLHRRTFLTGLASIIAAPAIVRASSLMPVKVMPAASELEILTIDTAYGMLTDMTRKAFVPRLFVQLYVSSPMMLEMENFHA